MYLISSPLEQFEVSYFFNCLYFNLNTVSFFLFIILVLYCLFLNINLYKKDYIFITFFLFSLVQFVAGLIYSNLGKYGEKYFSFLLTIFLFILFSNLVGMIPYAFTITSHIIVTISLSFIGFLGLNIIGFEKHKLHFFDLFLPKGCPAIMSPFLIIIELISYIARLFSLAIRLFANMMAGHSLLKILSNFGYVLLLKQNMFYLSIIPFLIVFCIVGLEIGIAMLQAYVFLILLIIYIHDAIYLH
jgi:ATP synthase subunit 6